MKTVLTTLFAALIASASLADTPKRNTLEVRQLDVPAQQLQLDSPDFTDGGRFADAQTAGAPRCSGANISPALNWSGVPDNAKSLALTMYDPDAPTGSGVWHWVVYNLPADSHGLPAGAGSEGGKLPEGAVTIRGDAGRLGYIGACPPPGDGEHRYIITLYALDRTLDLPADANPATLGFNLNGKILASGRIMATYSRPAAAQ